MIFMALKMTYTQLNMQKYATIIKHDIDGKLLPIKLKFDLIVVNQVIEHVKTRKFNQNC